MKRQNVKLSLVKTQNNKFIYNKLSGYLLEIDLIATNSEYLGFSYSSMNEKFM